MSHSMPSKPSGQRTKGGFDVVIGADGTWSPTQRLLPSQYPKRSCIADMVFDILQGMTTWAARRTVSYRFVNQGSILVH